MIYVQSPALYNGLNAVLSVTSGEPTSGVAFNIDPERGFTITARDDVCLASAMITLDGLDTTTSFVLTREAALGLHEFLHPFRREQWPTRVTEAQIRFFDGLAYGYESIGPAMVTPLYLASLDGGPVDSSWSTLIPETVWSRLRRVQDARGEAASLKLTRYSDHVKAAFGEWLKVYFKESP